MDWKPGRELTAFNALAREFDGIYHEIAVQLGLSDSAFLILYVIAEFGDGCLQKEIAKQYYVSKQTINSAIKQLVAKGYLTMQQGRGRDMHLHLTPTGRQFVAQRIAPVFEWENRVFAALSQEERETLLRLTEKYVTLCWDTLPELLERDRKEPNVP